MGPIGGNQKPEATARGRGGHCTAAAFPVRACGMEARGDSQSRTQVNPRKAGLPGQACRSTRRPVSNPWQAGIGGGGGEKSFTLPPRDLLRSGDGRAQEGNDAGSIPEEKSDRLIVAMKSVKADGAKGAMGFEA
jgi:hypothetical protein